MWPEPKMLHGLPRILWSSKQHAVTSSGGSQCQLINRQALSARFLDSRACRRGKTQSGNGEFRYFEQTVVIGDGADYDEGFGILGRVRGVSSQTGKGDGGTIDAGGEEAAEEDLVERGVGATCVSDS